MSTRRHHPRPRMPPPVALNDAPLHAPTRRQCGGAARANCHQDKESRDVASRVQSSGDQTSGLERSDVACVCMLSHADQGQLPITTQIDGPVLRFNWPALEIGVGSFEAGPTGLTIFRFPNKASAAVEVRGGAPGTVNIDFLLLGMPGRTIDAVVFSGGQPMAKSPSRPS